MSRVKNRRDRPILVNIHRFYATYGGKVRRQAETAQIKLVCERALCQIERQVVIVSGEVRIDFVFPIAPRVDGNSYSGRPIIYERIFRDLPHHVVLVPTRPDAERHIFTGCPRIVYEGGLINRVCGESLDTVWLHTELAAQEPQVHRNSLSTNVHQGAGGAV